MLASRRITLYLGCVSTLPEKVTLYFPSHELLWAFTSQARGINVQVQPAKLSVTGIFEKEDIEKAVQQFHATLLRA